MRTAVGIAAGALMLATPACDAGNSDSARHGYGDCEVTGRYGEFELTPEVPGSLTVEASLPAPGWWNGASPTTIKDGYEYCMAANIAYRSGLDRVEVKDVPFSAIVAGRTKGFDVALSEITITRDREKVADFSEPYFSANQGVLTRTGAKIDARSVRAARIGVSDGATGEKFVEDRLKPARAVKVFPNDPEMLAALANGQVDAVVHDVTLLLAYAQRSDGRLEVVGQYRTDEGIGALFQKGSPNRTTVDRIIGQMKRDGTLAKFSAVYLGAAYGRDPAKIPYFTIGRTA
ncbi:ABC transporter substrate-binding protein [Streptomyces fildesensis]|uniref:ABC transporter substrate-binding protein n=1 Tax=Streptomyces fildesensis TaxID=375757 RepID=A0ABW8CG66_9ACTN